MNTSDLFLTIMIIFIYIILILFTIILIAMSNIKDNWGKYRCNPIVIPFANLFGQDINENMQYCVKSIQAVHMKVLLKEIYEITDKLESNSIILKNNMTYTFKFVDEFRESVDFLSTDIFSVFTNLIIEMENTIYNFKDLFGKTEGTVTTLVNIIKTFELTMWSVFNGVKPILWAFGIDSGKKKKGKGKGKGKKKKKKK